MAPKVSFVIPSYNYGLYIEECISSIQKQCFTDFEILIMDDASTDDTPTVCQRLMSEDDRIRYCRQEKNVGHIANYNQGIQQTSGDLVWLISADDCLSHPDILSEFIQAFKAYPTVGYVFSRIQCIDENSIPYEKYIPRIDYENLPATPNRIKGHAFFKLLLKGNCVASPGAIARRECYEKATYFNSMLTHSCDWYNWLIFSLYWDVFYIPDPAVYYRKHNQNMHLTYQKPTIAVENSVLCYKETLNYLKEHKFSTQLQLMTALAQTRYKKSNQQSLKTVEKALYYLAKLVKV